MLLKPMSNHLTVSLARYRASGRRGAERERTVEVHGVCDLDAAVEAARVLGIREIARVDVEREGDSL